MIGLISIGARIVNNSWNHRNSLKRLLKSELELQRLLPDTNQLESSLSLADPNLVSKDSLFTELLAATSKATSPKDPAPTEAVQPDDDEDEDEDDEEGQGEARQAEDEVVFVNNDGQFEPEVKCQLL